jgi:hypothetical protein
MNYTITYGPKELRLAVTAPNIAAAAATIRALHEARAENLIAERDGVTIDPRLVLAASPAGGRLLRKAP